MLFDYQLDTSGDYNTSTGTVKKLVPNFVDKKKSTCFITKTCNFI